jgi:hypothetical protein
MITPDALRPRQETTAVYLIASLGDVISKDSCEDSLMLPDAPDP